MFSRCYDKTHKSYKTYGGRGIKICDDWHNLNKFRIDMIKMGWEYGLTLDRLDNNGDYCLDNIRLATRKQQANNKSNNRIITYKNQTMNLGQWSDVLGVRPDTLRRRLKKYGTLDKPPEQKRDEKGKYI